MVEFTGLKIESIKLSLKSIIGTIFHKEEHNEKTLNFKMNSPEVGTNIERQIVVNFPEGVNQNDQSKILTAILDDHNVIDTLVSPEASGETRIITPTTNSPHETFLKKYHQEYLVDNNLLLSRDALFFIYKGREGISFSEEELLFLTQSSFKNDFPVWFWLFNHRERFGNVVPLLKKVYQHTSLKIKKASISSLSDFTDTEDDLIFMMEVERDPEILGYAVSKFIEKKDIDRAQRLVANALTRKIIPILTSKIRKKLEDVKFELGAVERRVLRYEIENGWQSDRVKALTILNLSAEEVDLPFLEELLTRVSHNDVINLILGCIRRIGKTNKAEYIRNGLEETRSDETFFAYLNTLVGVKYKAIFPLLLSWLSDSTNLTNKFWSDTGHRKVDDKIEEAIIALLDKETYEILVQYILKKYKPDDNGNIMSWRHFWIFRHQNNSEIVELLKSETRLNDFKPWKEVIDKLIIYDKNKETDVGRLIDSVKPESSKEAYLTLRRVYEIITPEQAFIDVSPIISLFRENLTRRLSSIADGEFSEDIKDLSKNDLENFLGENRTFYRLQRKRKKGSRYEIEGEKNEEFDTLSTDIDNFSIIEKEYFAHVFKSKSDDINKLLLSSIGRPYETIYESLEGDGDLENISKSLLESLEVNKNPLIKIKIIAALLRLKKGDIAFLHAKVLTILIEARDNVKVSKGMVEDSDDWFVSEITYLWAINILDEFSLPEDFLYIKEATNRENIFSRSYNRYSSFFDYAVFEELLSLSENLEDLKERESAFSALNTLDYKWTKDILGFE